MSETIDEVLADMQADRLDRALSAQGEAVTSPLDLSAPQKVWLQIDPNGDAEDRSEAIPRAAWDDLTWHYESVGGQEVEYVRADLARPAPARMTEEMVERACAAAHPGWPTARPDDDRNRMRAALTAALEADKC